MQTILSPSTLPRPRRRLLLTGAVLACALLWAGCAALGPRNISLSQGELQTLLERQFPRQQRVLELIDVSITRPTLRLLPERNRLATDLELSALERLSGRSARGNLSLDYGLRFEPSDASVRLTQVRVQDFRLELGGSANALPMNRIGALLAERLLDDLAIYRLSPERAQRLRNAGVQNAEINVTALGIEIKLADPR